MEGIMVLFTLIDEGEKVRQYCLQFRRKKVLY